MKKTSKSTGYSMCIGMCIGCSLGVAFGNLTTGLVLGLLAGLLFGTLKDEKVNSQLEEKGYTVKALETNEATGETSVTVVDKSGAEQIVLISREQMLDEAFEIGDKVYIDEEGTIEQAYDKDEE